MARILIVDDENSIRRTLGEFLRLDGHEVVEAEDAFTALHCLQAAEFDVVVTDIILPQVTGVELLQRIRLAAPHVQVVMMTGEPTVDTARESLRAGAADYLFKPITKEAILRTVATTARLKALEDAKRRLEAENRAHQENLEWLVDERTRQLRASEEQAREVSRFNQSVLDALTAHIAVLATDGTILAVNRAWGDGPAADSHLAPQVKTGANYLAACEAVTGEDEESARKVVRGLRALARGNLPEFSLEYACHSPDAPRWFLLRATRFNEGEMPRMVIAHTNITARKQVEAALRESETHLAEAQRMAHLGSWVADLHNLDDQIKNPLWWSDEVFRIFGYEPGAIAVTHEQFNQAVHPDDRAGLWAVSEQALRERRSYQMEHRIVWPDGTERVVQEHAEIVCDEATGRPAKFIGTVQDITERKKGDAIREALLSLGARLSTATTATEVARSIFATADKLWKWDAGALDIVLPGEDVAQNVLCLDVLEGGRGEVPPTTAQGEPTPRMRRVMAQGAELTLRTPEELAAADSLAFGDTRRLSASLLCVPIRRRGDSVGVLSIQSYTPRAFTPDDLLTLQGLADYCGGALERIQVEEKLHEQAALLDAANDAIYVRALDGTVRFWNQGAERLLGWTSAEALGRKIGETVPHEANAFEAAHAAVLKQDSWAGDLRMTTKKGKQVMVFCHWTLLRDEQGLPREVLATGTDITDKKQLEAQFLRAQRLEGIGSLASGIAHDLNNILAPVLMIAPLLRDSNPDPENRMMLDTIENSARRGADIIKQLLSFARGTPGARLPLPIRHLLRDMDQILRETFPRDIRSCIEMPKALWPVLGDATQLHQSLMNLCVNARDAMPDGGTLKIGAKNVTVDAAAAARETGVQPGPFVCLSVTDTGSGISLEDQEHIFDPFFTTKEIGKGTGLGLATVLGIVRGHQGFVQVESQMGHGTTFHLYFPASPGDLKPEISNLKLPKPPRGQGEMILVVDDEASVRDSVRRTLETHGYRVITASHGVDGLAAFSDHRASVRAVLTDMMMPVMNGPAMITALRALEPNLPVLGMTGLPDRTGVKGFEHVKLSVLLAKPFTGGDLLRALHAALVEPAEAASPQGTE